MNATQKKLLGKTAIFAIAGAMLLGQVFSASGISVEASAEGGGEEIVYYDDFVYGDSVFQGQGTLTSSSYDISCDEMITVSSSLHMSAPSFATVPDSSMDNYCGAMAGRNVVGFYDRWYTNLIPDYTPGMMSTTGIYRYYPDVGVAATNAVMTRMYELMRIDEVGGTTSSNFKSGLSAYATEKGYSTSYSSFHSNATTVNLTQLTTAINQNKVGVIMCSQYNFIYSILLNDTDENVHVTKINSTTAHMMMVYGYETRAFYYNDSLVCTKTFLYVSSGFGDCELGYMELNDFSVINEAVIVSIS